MRKEREEIGAVVVAAGQSRRMAGADKMWLPLDGVPVLERTLAALVAIPALTRLVVVLSESGLERAARLRATAAPPWDRATALVVGGAERADSVYAGLVTLGRCDLVLIHDGARPLVTPDLVRAALASARAHGAASPALAVTDTIKRIDGEGRIVDTVDRTFLRAVQTPQVFRYDLLLRAYEEMGAARTTCTDDAMLLERQGLPVATIPGDPHNIKVTTPDDLPLALLYLRERGAG